MDVKAKGRIFFMFTSVNVFEHY